MPIYKIKNKHSGEVIAVKANTRAQAVNFIIGISFEAETMKSEEIVDYMEAGNTVKDATASEDSVKEPESRNEDAEAAQGAEASTPLENPNEQEKL